MLAMQEARWTLDELAERVDAALAVDYTGQPSGRVRDVPDRRAIRWYTTIGLIDRPLAHQGRTALYGPRHLLQLVAVKRLQARGLPLVAIQQELAGATDAQLARVARLPAATTPEPRPGPLPVASRPAAVAARAAVGRARRTGFWREQPAAFTAAATARPAGPAGPVPDEAGTARGATLQGIRVGDGATLLLEPGRELGPEDVRAVLEAAGPLLAVLRERGLGAVAPGPDQDQTPRPAGGTEPRREHP
jgi:DNA-binding transcriptional MerR regulator